MPKNTVTYAMEMLLLRELTKSKDSRTLTAALIPIVRGSPHIQVDRSDSKSLDDTIRWALIWMCDRGSWVTRPFGALDGHKKQERMSWIKANRPGQALDQQVWEITDAGRALLQTTEQASLMFPPDC